MDEVQATLERLMKIRNQDKITIRPTPMLRSTIAGSDGVDRPFTLRSYQVQMILHLLSMRRFIVGDDTGLGKCQPGNTIILTNRGLIRLDAIEDTSGMAPDSFRHLDKPTSVLVDGEALPIKSLYYGGVKPTITVTTRYMFQNTGSRIHPVLVLRGGERRWVQTQDLQLGDVACIERRLMEFPHIEPILVAGAPHLPEMMTPELARFLGYYIGEGCLTARFQVRLSQSPTVNTEIHADIIRLFSTLFKKIPKNVEIPDLYVNDVRIRRWLAANGLEYCRSMDRIVPDCVLQSTRASSVEFLKALFEGEAHVGLGHIEYSTASEELGRQIQVMLLRFGIVAARRPKQVKGRDHTYWRLTICGRNAESFQDQIGFISRRKVDALVTLVDRPRNTNHDVVPGMQDLFEQVRIDLTEMTRRTGANQNRIGSGIKQFGQTLVNTLNNIRNYGRNPSYDFINRVVSLLDTVNPQATSLQVLRAILDSHYFYDPIDKIEEGSAEVFDIEVDDPQHAFIGNGFVNHNTIESIASLCYLWEKEPDSKALILTRKSAVRQWVDEFAKFTTGVHVFTCTGTPKQRDRVRRDFANTTGACVLVMGHRSAVQDFTHLQDETWDTFILDEAAIAKNPMSQVHQVCRHLSAQSKRVWGLTATLIKNNLIEGYGIFKAIEPSLFKHTLNAFIDDYCVTQLIDVGRGRKVKRVVGYKKSDIERFRMKIEPYFLGRPKHQVAVELPPLTVRRIKVGMSPVQTAKYQEALAGILELGTGEEKEVSKLTAVTYCQQIANHPELIGVQGDSEKLDELIELLTDGDLDGEKVIIFTRFEKMVGIGVAACEKAGVKCVRITGKENEDARKRSQDLFQDPKSDVRAVWITTAGSDAINLQAAKAIVFYDTPFAAGDFLQALGRMIRIGSIHDRVFAIHLIVVDSVDERIMDIMDGKMELLEAVLGKRIKGDDDGDIIIDADNGVDALFESLRKSAKSLIKT